MAKITISQRQTPCFRALIATDAGTLFDPATDLATQAELDSEHIDAAPLSYSVFKTDSALYYQGSGDASPVEGFQDVAIDPSDALIDPTDVSADELDYNFSFVPAARAAFPFADVGSYFIDFTMFPKVGAAIVWRTWVYVQ